MLPRIRNLVFLCALSSTLMACSAVQTATEAQPSIDGTWKEQVQSRLPGIRGDVIELHSTGTQVSGTGSYSMEAGPSGTLSISGSYQAPNVTLTITRDRGMVATYQAKLIDATHMRGTMRYENFGSYEKTFVRQ